MNDITFVTQSQAVVNQSNAQKRKQSTAVGPAAKGGSSISNKQSSLNAGKNVTIDEDAGEQARGSAMSGADLAANISEE